MSGHAPGPWKWVRIPEDDKICFLVDSSMTSVIPGIEAIPVQRFEDEANALLIAASPDLLAALLQLESDVLGTGDGTGWYKAACAIAKATGKEEA